MIRRITVFLAMAIMSTYICSAQLNPEKFLASEGYSAALAEAQTITENLEFLAIGTTTGEFDTGNALIGTLDLQYELSSGKATVWVYVFKDLDADTRLYYGVAKLPFLGMVAISLDQGQLGKFSDVIPTQPITGNWLSSSKFSEEMQKNSDYKSFLNAFPDPNINFVALGRNIEKPIDPDPYWTINLNDGMNILTCLMNAYTGEIECNSFVSSVDETQFSGNNISVYPNPVKNNAIISLPSSLQSSEAIFSIYDMQGNEVKRLVNPNSAAETLLLDVSSLSNGKYIISYVSASKSLSCSLIISR